MPYDHCWLDDDHTILYVHMHGEVSWEAWHTAVDAFVAEVTNRTDRIDLILHDEVGMPKGDRIAHMRLTMQRFDIKSVMGIVVIVNNRTQSILTKAVLTVLTKLTNAPQTVYVSTVEDALEVIKRARML